MITLALAQMVFFICLQAPFTGGEDGLQAVPRGLLLGHWSLMSDTVMYYVVAAIFLACYLGIARIVNSPFGQVLKMIRENEPRAVSLGYEVDRYKLLAFVLSAALAGLAGSLKTLVMGFATLSDVHWSMSGEVILMSLLGGVGTLFGPVLGAGIVIALQNLLADKVGSWVTVIIGAIFVICVMTFRKGVVGELQAFMERRRQDGSAVLARSGEGLVLEASGFKLEHSGDAHRAKQLVAYESVRANAVVTRASFCHLAADSVNQSLQG